MIYLSSKKNVKDLLFFSLSINNKKFFSDIEDLIKYIDDCNIPKFPISGDYLKSIGYKTGQELGNKLKLLEKKWIENNFVLEKDTIEKSLDKTIKN